VVADAGHRLGPRRVAVPEVEIDEPREDAVAQRRVAGRAARGLERAGDTTGLTRSDGLMRRGRPRPVFGTREQRDPVAVEVADVLVADVVEALAQVASNRKVRLHG